MTWHETRLKYLAALPITNGLGEAAKEGDASWPRYIRTTDISGPRSLAADKRVTLHPSLAARAAVRPGDLLMTAAGSLGKVYLHSGPEPSCYAGYLVRFRARTDLVDPRFVAYWAESQPFLDQIAIGAVRSTIDNFSAGKYQNLSLHVPDLVEQRRIADFLDAETAHIDRLVQLRLRQGKLAEEQLSARLDEALGRSQTYSHGTPLAVLTDPMRPIQYGIVLPGPDYPGGVPIIKGGDIATGRMAPEILNRTDPMIEQAYARSRVRGGDLVIAIRGSVGEVARVPDHLAGANLTQDSARIAPRNVDAE